MFLKQDGQSVFFQGLYKFPAVLFQCLDQHRRLSVSWRSCSFLLLFFSHRNDLLSREKCSRLLYDDTKGIVFLESSVGECAKIGKILLKEWKGNTG